MVKQTLTVIDPGLAEGLEGLALEEMEAGLVSFKSSAEHWWIHQALDLPLKVVGVAQQQDPIAPGDSQAHQGQ